ncbi:MAG: efflux RND transporter periplasmic adaptor subunit [Roseibacillus sp.]
MNRIRKFIPLFALLLLLMGCEGPSEPAHEDHHDEGEAETPTNRVEIPALVRSNLGITFAKVERREVATTIRVPGSFELQPRASQEFRAMLPGTVEFRVGQFDVVQEGAVLYRFRSTAGLQLQAKIELAQAALLETKAKAQSSAERLRKLQAAGFKRAELEAEVGALAAEVSRQEAELRVAQKAASQFESFQSSSKPGEGDVGSSNDDWIEIRATRAAVVQSLAVTNGAFVPEGDLLLTTIDPQMIRFRALALQSDLPLFEQGQLVRIVPPQARGASINESLEASLTLGLSSDPATRTTTIYAIPTETAPWAKAGVSAFLEVATESTEGVVLAIPRSAVVKDGITHVFFQRDPLNANKAIRVEADLGVDDGRWVEVKSGLGPQDEVVFDGAYELKLATSQSGSSQKGGHFHADGTFHAE